MRQKNTLYSKNKYVSELKISKYKHIYIYTLYINADINRKIFITIKKLALNCTGFLSVAIP